MSKKRLSVVLAICALAAAARAEEPHDRSFKVYGTLDFFAPTTAADGLWNDTQSSMQELASEGVSSSANIDTKAAVGARLGLMFPIDASFDLGVSAGFIAGPHSNVNVMTSGRGVSDTLTDDRTLSYVRLLVEPTLNVPMGATSAFHLALGLGAAQGTTKESVSCSGTDCPSGTSGQETSTWNGFTWEVSPYISIRRLLFGLRYAGFPSFGGNANNSAIKWTTTGFFLGFEF